MFDRVERVAEKKGRQKDFIEKIFDLPLVK